jgi:hypothetical protein
MYLSELAVVRVFLFDLVAPVELRERGLGPGSRVGRVDGHMDGKHPRLRQPTGKLLQDDTAAVGEGPLEQYFVHLAHRLAVGGDFDFQGRMRSLACVVSRNLLRQRMRRRVRSGRHARQIQDGLRSDLNTPHRLVVVRDEVDPESVVDQRSCVGVGGAQHILRKVGPEPEDRRACVGGIDRCRGRAVPDTQTSMSEFARGLRRGRRAEPEHFGTRLNHCSRSASPEEATRLPWRALLVSSKRCSAR